VYQSVANLQLALNAREPCGCPLSTHSGQRRDSILDSFASMKGQRAICPCVTSRSPHASLQTADLHAHTRGYTHGYGPAYICCEHDEGMRGGEGSRGFLWGGAGRAGARIIYAKFARRRARGERAWQNAKGRMRNAECPLGRPDETRAADPRGRRGERETRQKR